MANPSTYNTAPEGAPCTIKLGFAAPVLTDVCGRAHADSATNRVAANKGLTMGSLLVFADVQRVLPRDGQRTGDQFRDGTFIGFVITEQASHPDLGHWFGRQCDVESCLATLYGLAGLRDREPVSHLESLARAAGDVDLAAIDLENVGSPGPLFKLRHESALNIGDGCTDCPVIQRSVVVRLATIAGNLTGLGAGIASTAGGEKHIARARIHQAYLDFGMCRLDLG